MVNNYDVAVLSEKVAYLENALKTAGVLPEVSASDNGAALQVVNGAWAKGDTIPEVINVLDSTSETAALSAAQGKVLNTSINEKIIYADSEPVTITAEGNINNIGNVTLPTPPTGYSVAGYTIMTSTITDSWRVNLTLLTNVSSICFMNYGSNQNIWTGFVRAIFKKN